MASAPASGNAAVGASLTTLAPRTGGGGSVVGPAARVSVGGDVGATAGSLSGAWVVHATATDSAPNPQTQGRWRQITARSGSTMNPIDMTPTP